ncbi:D-arabinono-1,4-lactone oxidase [Undibacterium sp. Ji67W]|uniref:D-arabinono-1,4-lactone oxidase n=1 Tax=Undibacterium sp. Ji67W TaxID=3413042 RepID=UPI003BF1C0AE
MNKISTRNINPAHIWQNWGQSVTATPEKIFTPHSIAEVITIVNDARQAGKTIRVVGTGHSWSPLVPTNDILISMSKFNTIFVAPDRSQVTIGPGVTVDQLTPVLIENSVCLPSDVGQGVGEATYGGIVSTGCHGSGINMLTTSDYVVALEVITSHGEVARFDETDPALLNAAKLALGMFGIITNITFKVQPAFNVQVNEFKCSIDDCLKDLKSFVLDNDYAEVSWFPFNDQVFMQKANKTTLPVTRVGPAPPSSAFDVTLNAAIGATSLSALETDPDQTPDIIRAGFRMMSLYDYVCNVTDYLHNTDYSPILPYKILDIEFAFNIDEEFNDVRKAFRICIERVEKWQQAGLYPLNGAMGFRFTKNSDATLSPAKGNTYTAWMEFNSFYKTDLFTEFAGQLVQDLLHELPQARPHWAKGFQFMPETIPNMKHAFGAQLNEFNALKAKAGVDPEGVFVNQYLKSLFFT